MPKRLSSRGSSLTICILASLIGLCRTWLLNGKVKKALEVGQQAIGLKYHEPAAHFLSVTPKEDGGSWGAIGRTRRALQNPNFVEAHEKLERSTPRQNSTKNWQWNIGPRFAKLESEQSELVAGNGIGLNYSRGGN